MISIAYFGLLIEEIIRGNTMSKKPKGKKKNTQKKRDGNILAHVRGEINLNTRSESVGKKKYSRKEKHKGKSNQ